MRTFTRSASAIMSFAVAYTVVAVCSASVVSTNADANVLDPLFPNAAGPPLLNLKILSGSTSAGGIFTNQINGTAGLSGDVITVAAQLIETAIDGVSYSPIQGPSGGQVVALTGLSGSLSAPGVVTFTAATLTFVELVGAPGGFDPRNPESWTSPGATVLGVFDLAPPTDVLPSPLGSGTTLAPASLVNLSGLNPILANGATGSLLFNEQLGGTFLENYDTPNGQVDDGSLYVEVRQRVDLNSTGSTVQGAPALSAADLAILDAIANTVPGIATGFTGGAGSVAHVSPPTGSFYMDPSGVTAGTGTGDFFATFSADAFPMVALPEAASVIAWLGLMSAAGGLGMLRHRRS